MRRTWLLLALAICSVLLLLVFVFFSPPAEKIYLARDAFDPMSELLEPFVEGDIISLSPYPLGQHLAGMKGMVFVYGTQVRYMEEISTLADYTPLYSASIVIAVNRNGNSAGKIDGWYSLLQSEAVVLIPDNGVESGRLAAIALARGLGAKEGDITPALQAYRQLADQGRLNPASEYADAQYRNVYPPQRPAAYDAVIMWDYQARRLAEDNDVWDIVMPVEGSVTVTGGYVLTSAEFLPVKFQETTDYLTSQEGELALQEAGFAALGESDDLSAWDEARLLFNPRFRRLVRQVKLHAPASVRERLLLKSVTFLLFCIAAWKVVQRVPDGLHRRVSTSALFLVLLWMLTGIFKTIAMQPDPIRYFWFATYISRHSLPIAWYCMCYLHVYGRLPGKNRLMALLGGAIVLTVFVFTNDWHRQVFIYTQTDSVTWEHQYNNGWGYYLSLTFSFILSLYGLSILFREKISRQQKRQYVYAGIFFLLLILYQVSYIFGLERIIDLDIPTTVAIFIIVFILAAQRERFMGAQLLALPTFQNTPHAIAVYNRQGKKVYRNKVMELLETESCISSETDAKEEIFCRGKVFRPDMFKLDNGSALILEDISDLKFLEKSLELSHKKLEALHKLLLGHADRDYLSIGWLEKESHSRQIDVLLKKTLENARQELELISSDEPVCARQDLHRIRLLIFICQQRLRLLITGLETYPLLSVNLVKKYGAAIMANGQKMGLDGVFTTDGAGEINFSMLPRLLTIIDRICLLALSVSDSSLVIHLEKREKDIALSAVISREKEIKTYLTKKQVSEVWRGMPLKADYTIDYDCLSIRLQMNTQEESE